jgi:UDP-glucose 4-epimerase
VTGGAGFVGSHVVDRLLKEKLNVIVLDDLSSGKLENIKQHFGKKNFSLLKGDIRDERFVRRVIRDVDAVIHHAALISVSESTENPLLTNDVNVTGTLNLLEASITCDVDRFIYASTCAVYGDTKTLPVREDYMPQPISPYGVSKLAAENYVRVFNDVYGLDTVCLRYFNVYGPRQAYNQYSGVITQFMSCISENRNLTIFGDGEQTRDFVNVKDIVEANVLALKSKGATGEIFNIATGVATKIEQLANMLLEAAGKPHLKILYDKPRKGDIRHSYADISKAQKKLDYKPKIPLMKGLEELIENIAY